MTTAPLKPLMFPPVGTGPLFNLPANVTPQMALAMLLLFYFAVLCWAIYTLIAIYHWFKYSHASTVAFPAIITHLLVSLVLMSYAFSGLL